MRSRLPEAPAPARPAGSLRALLTYPFVILMVVAVIVTGFLSLYNSGNAVEKMAWLLMDEIGARIEDRVSRLLNRAHLVNAINANAIESGQIDLNDARRLELHFWSLLRSFDLLSYAYIGRADGGFFGARRLADGTLQTMATDTPTSGEIRFFNTDDQGRHTTIGSSLPYYDPKSRPWYKAGTEAGKPTWSPVFVDAGGEGLTITAVTPLYEASGMVKGVLGCSFVFSQINQYLQRMKIGESGLTFIVDRSGMLVATSTLDPTYKSGKERIASVESENPRISRTSKSIMELLGDFAEIDRQQRLFIHLDNERYFVRLSPITDLRGVDWLIVVALPETGFMADIKAGNRSTVFLSLLALGVTAAVGLAIARRITRPLLELTVAARSLADGDWSRELKVDRRDEVGELAGSFNLMVKNLKATTVSRDRLAEEAEERKKVESELQKLAAVVEHSSELVTLTTLSGSMLFLNEAGGLMLGMAPRDVEGHSIMEAIPEELKSRVENEVLPTVLNEGRWEGELQYRNHGNGSILDVHAMIFTIGNAEAEPRYLAHVCLDITMQKRAEEARRESEEKFSIAFHHAPVIAAITVVEDGTYLDVNKKFLEMFGLEREQVIGRTSVELGWVKAEDRKRLIEILNREGNVSGLEFTCYSSDGTPIECLYYCNPVNIGGNKRMLTMLLDVTERKRAEEQLRASESMLRSVFQAIPIGVTFAMDRILVAVNDSMCELTGYDREEMLGESVRKLYETQQEYEYAGHELYSRIRQKGRSSVETRFRRKDGTLIEVSLTAAMLRAEDPSLGYVVTVQDITRRKQAEDEMRRLRNHLSNIINSMPSVLVGVDADGTVTQWNTAAAKATGVEADLALGQPIERLMPLLSQHRDRLRKAITARTVETQMKLSRLVDGETRYEDLTVYPLVCNGIEGAVIRVDDVTDRVRIEEMMIQSEKMLSVGGLAAGMAHEINNPLGVILQASQNVLRRVSPDFAANARAAEECGVALEGVRSYLERREILAFLEDIRQSGQRAAEIVTNMLSFSRKADGEGSATDLAELLDRTVSLAASDYDLKRHYDFRKIEIVREYQPRVPLVICQPGKIQQVFFNLLRNGAEAMKMEDAPDRASRFVFRVLRDEDMVRVEIEDNGNGMDEATRRRVFEPFFTTKPTGLGTGLGLSVSYFIVTEEHGGTLSVTSKPGSGTCFVIRLPVAGRAP